MNPLRLLVVTILTLALLPWWGFAASMPAVPEAGAVVRSQDEVLVAGPEVSQMRAVPRCKGRALAPCHNDLALVPSDIRPPSGQHGGRVLALPTRKLRGIVPSGMTDPPRRG